MIEVEGYRVQTIKEISETHYIVGDKVDALACIDTGDGIKTITACGKAIEVENDSQPLRIQFDGESIKKLLVAIPKSIYDLPEYAALEMQTFSKVNDSDLALYVYPVIIKK